MIDFAAINQSAFEKASEEPVIESSKAEVNNSDVEKILEEQRRVITVKTSQERERPFAPQRQGQPIDSTSRVSDSAYNGNYRSSQDYYGSRPSVSSWSAPVQQQDKSKEYIKNAMKACTPRAEKKNENWNIFSVYDERKDSAKTVAPTSMFACKIVMDAAESSLKTLFSSTQRRKK